MRQKGHYHVYVIELDRRVWRDNKKFREANPGYNGKTCCLYVGMTSKTPKERFEQHKSGYRNKKGIRLSSNIVEKYGRFLRPSLYAPLNPMPRERAIRLEKTLAESLKKRGYAVWWN